MEVQREGMLMGRRGLRRGCSGQFSGSAIVEMSTWHGSGRGKGKAV